MVSAGEGKKIKIINVGIKLFAESIEKQGFEVINIDWNPPAQGDDDILKILASFN